jgi:UDP-glucose 4-epimerase
MKLAGKNVMVTGGAGFIGSHLVDRLIEENPAKIVVVDNFFLGRKSNLEHAIKAFPDLKILRLDASDLSSMQQVVLTEKIEVVFNLAVVPLPTSLDYPLWTVQQNIGIAAVMCELARYGHIQTLIHSSSSEGYGSALYIPMDEKHPLEACTPYAASKASADLLVLSYCHTFNIDAAILRPFNNYGPRQNHASYAGIIPIVTQRVKNGIPVEIYGDGEQTRDYVFVKDTAEAFVRVYRQEQTRGQVINIGSGLETSVNDLVTAILGAIGAPAHPVVHTAPRPGDVRRHCAGIELARSLIDFKPSAISIENLKETIDWYLQE